MVVSGGACADNTLALAMLEAGRVPRKSRGRPRKRPDCVLGDNCVLGDKGYSYPSCRRQFRQRGLKMMISERRDQRAQRVKKEQKAKKSRRVVVPGLRLKQSRRVAPRYDKTKARCL